ncbi:MAG: putative DNA binding domain-containing protein [Ignavibacteriae bacterium]|nr:putative DNA binding domain-containing protein [Ignavibacteriota bacterium]
MPLPININELINGKSVEWERIEFKKGWNPQRTLHSICAFANDFNNWGGGYIIVGIEANNGQPILPPQGLEISQIDSIQKELNNICRRIIPNYFPVVEPVDFQGKKILILWCPGGSNRPYKAPEILNENSQYHYFIRRFSSTVRPTIDEERELIGMSNQIPFDDQVNNFAKVTHFDLTQIKLFLNEVKSDLEFEIPNLTIQEIARKMNIAEGAEEHLLPKNVGILFFAKNPQQFFPQAKIEIVTFVDDVGDNYSEKIFSGSLHNQLRNALNYIKVNIIEEKVEKVKGIAESNRFFNYPFEAVEESLANAVFHRGYNENSPIEVRIYPAKIHIISFPGPLPPLNREKLSSGVFDIRKYRNRRIGEFLKDLHLTEGRATGIPKIKKSLEKNGSPVPIFETDDNRTYFKTTLKIHPKFEYKDLKSVQVSVQVSEQANLLLINNLDEILNNLDTFGEQVSEQVRAQVSIKTKPNKKENLIKILKYTLLEKSRSDILKELSLSDNYRNYHNYIFPLLEINVIAQTMPQKPQSPKQKYIVTDKGKRLLEILE